MPWGELLSDYLRNQRESRRQKQNDRWTKLMQASGLIKDVWTTVSGRKAEEEAAATLFGRQTELAKTQHGWNLEEYGKKYDYDTMLADVNWARQQAKDRGDEEAAKRLANFNDELERKRNNQTFVNSMIETAARGEWDEKIQKIANEGKGVSTDIMEWYNAARKEATAKFYIQDPDTGEYTLKPGVTEAQIRLFFSRWAKSAAAADRPRLQEMFDAWIEDPYWEEQGKPIPTPTGAISTKPADASIIKTALQTAKQILTSGKKIGAGTAEGWRANITLEGSLQEAAKELGNDPTLDKMNSSEALGYYKEMEPLTSVLPAERLRIIYDALMKIAKTLNITETPQKPAPEIPLKAGNIMGLPGY